MVETTTKVTCPKCGYDRFQQVMNVIATSPAELERAASGLVWQDDPYGAGAEVIWEACEYLRIECASCCEEIEHCGLADR